MKRLFWGTMGLGAGVGGAIMVSRWMRRQKERYSPANIGTHLAAGARDLGGLMREAVDEGRRAMQEREAEIRSQIPQ